MTTEAISSQGAMLLMGDSATPEVFTAIAEITSDLADPSSPPAWHDATSHSTVGGYREEIPGLRSNTDWQFSGNYFADATHEALRTAKNANALKNFQVLSSAVTGSAKTLATSAATDDIVDTTTAHGFTAGDRVQFSGLVGGTGLSNATVYYVLASGLISNGFKVSLTAGGTAVDFSADITAGTVAEQISDGASFSAFVSEFVVKRPVDGIKTFDCTLHISGAIADIAAGVAA